MTFLFRNFSVSKLFPFLDGFKIGIKEIGSESDIEKHLVSIKVLDLVSEKVSDSVSFRFWVSSHTGWKQ